MFDIITRGTVNYEAKVHIVDATTGSERNDIVWDTPGLSLWYRRDGGLKVSITLASLSALNDAHSDGGFLLISDGDYRIDLPDAAVVGGGPAFVDFGGAGTGIKVYGSRIRLTGINLNTAINGGMQDIVDIKALLEDGTVGLSALKTLVDAVNTDLSNGTDGLGALKALIDAVNADLSNGTDGLGALKAVLDSIFTATITNASGADIAADVIAVKADTAANKVILDSMTFSNGLLHVDAKRILAIAMTGDGQATPVQAVESMSLEQDGFWKAGFWSPGFWADGFWSEASVGPMDTKIRVLQGQLAADTTPLDLTFPGTGTPTGVIIFTTNATALNTEMDDVSISIGVSDFTTTATHATNSDDGLAAASSNHKVIHQETNVIHICTPGTDTVIRSCTIASIANGIRLTPQQSGDQLQVLALVFWGTGIKAFSAGATTIADADFTVSHGFAAAPKACIAAYTDRSNNSDDKLCWSIGFMAYDGSITQSTVAYAAPEATDPTEIGAQLFSTRIGGFVDKTGAEIGTVEVTDNDATETTFTARTATMNGDLIGLLIELPDVSAKVLNIETPIDDSIDWKVTGSQGIPQVVFTCTSIINNIDTTRSGGTASGFGFTFLSETTNVYGVNCSFQAGVNTVTGHSRMDDRIFMATHGGEVSVKFDMNPVTNVMKNGGFTIPASAINVVNPNTRYWPTLFIQTSVSQSENIKQSSMARIRRKMAFPATDIERDY